jgi:heme exporter protein CcmD
MSEFFSMGGNGAYVWSAYGITLVVLIWNVWAARSRLKRNLRLAARDGEPEPEGRRPRVTRL